MARPVLEEQIRETFNKYEPIVRLRLLNSELFPDMPKLTEVISCGLVTKEEFNYDPAEAREFNSRPEMDGTSRTEAALACVTDEDGYVEMVVKYAEELGAATLLRQVFTSNLPAIPEYVRNSLTTNAIFAYDAFKVDFTEGEVTRACTSGVPLAGGGA